MKTSNSGQGGNVSQAGSQAQQGRDGSSKRTPSQGHVAFASKPDQKVSPSLITSQGKENSALLGKRSLRSPTTVLINNIPNQDPSKEEEKGPAKRVTVTKGCLVKKEEQRNSLQDIINSTNLSSTIGSGGGAFKAPANVQNRSGSAKPTPKSLAIIEKGKDTAKRLQTAAKSKFQQIQMEEDENSYSYSESEDYGDEGDFSIGANQRRMNALMAEESESPISGGDFDMLTGDKFFENLINPSVSPFLNPIAVFSGIKPAGLNQSAVSFMPGNIKQSQAVNQQNSNEVQKRKMAEASATVDNGESSSLSSPFKSGQNYEIDTTNGFPKMPSFDKNLNYMDEYWNIYLQNQALLAQIDKIANDRNDLLLKTFKIESFYDQNLDRLQSERYSSGRKKHHRRCANDIERRYKCPYQKCEKFYGSEGSLNLHIKIKHNGGNKTDREKIAKSIVFAKANGINMSAESLVGDLNLPPGAVERAAQAVGIKLDDDSIKKLEADLIMKQEIKKKKELEILKQLQQQQLLPIMPESFGTQKKSGGASQESLQQPFGDRIITQNQQPNFSSDGVFKIPPLPSKSKLAKMNSENDGLARNVGSLSKDGLSSSVATSAPLLLKKQSSSDRFPQRKDENGEGLQRSASNGSSESNKKAKGVGLLPVVSMSTRSSRRI